MVSEKSKAQKTITWFHLRKTLRTSNIIETKLQSSGCLVWVADRTQYVERLLCSCILFFFLFRSGEIFFVLGVEPVASCMLFLLFILRQVNTNLLRLAFNSLYSPRSPWYSILSLTSRCDYRTVLSDLAQVIKMF